MPHHWIKMSQKCKNDPLYRHKRVLYSTLYSGVDKCGQRMSLEVGKEGVMDVW